MSSNGESVAGSDVVIDVSHVSKSYRIYDRPLDRLKQSFAWGRKQYYREFMAVNDVSFQVGRGEAMGIIGRNGSGKSTLLQIIAGTLAPLSGTATVRGRISALLELGSGFNPDFSGRENVFMNGAILGIPRKEMEKRFDDIAAFADIGDFLDQPVKTYSSGMFARLAFAVAINVDPDILIVDEILSVGDAVFQQKCVSRMREMRERGLTLLFVSHSVDAIKSVCNNAVLIEHGQVLAHGAAERVVDRYLELVHEELNRRRDVVKVVAHPVPEAPALAGLRRHGTGAVRITGCRLLNGQDQPVQAYMLGELIQVEVELVAGQDVDDLNVSFVIRDGTGIDLIGTTTFDERVSLPPQRAGGKLVVRFAFQNPFRAGSYGVCVAITRVTDRAYSDNLLFDQIDAAAAFEVIGNHQRPVHYKLHIPCRIEFQNDRLPQ